MQAVASLDIFFSGCSLGLRLTLSSIVASEKFKKED